MPSLKTEIKAIENAKQISPARGYNELMDEYSLH
jgi:hypothetical protein